MVGVGDGVRLPPVSRVVVVSPLPVWGVGLACYKTNNKTKINDFLGGIFGFVVTVGVGALS